MCAAKKGHTVSQETRDKIGAAHRQENHYVLCPCGNNIRVTKHQLKRGRKKYCSKDCKHKFFSRRSTGKYTKRKINTGWFKKGNNPWNDGLVGVMPTPPNFKGDDVGYDALHDWVSRILGRPSKCEHCGKEEGRFEWANKSHQYKRDISDWIRLCKKCHIRYDRDDNDKNWGVATKKYSLNQRKKR